MILRHRSSLLATGAVSTLIGLLVLLGVVNLQALRRVEKERLLVRHSMDVLAVMRDVSIAARDSERGQRGYLLTGQASYLAPYEAALTRLPALQDELAAMTRGSDGEQRLEGALRAVLDRKLDELGRTIALRRAGDEAAALALVRGGEGEAAMKTASALLDRLMAGEALHLQTERARILRSERRLEGLTNVATLSGVVFLLAAAMILRRTIGALRRSEAGFRLLTENANDIVVRLTASGEVSYASPSIGRILGVAPEQIIGRPGLPFVHPDDRGTLRASTARLLDGAVDEEELTCRVLRPDGACVWLETRRRVLRDGAHGAIGVVARDITGRRATEAERDARARDLEQSNAQLERLARHLAQARDQAQGASSAKTRFLASMSHELRTPLNAILGYAQLLRLEGSLDEVQVVRVEGMLDAGRHLLDMINRVLNLSEIETAGISLRTATVALRAVCEACLGVVSCAADAKGLSLHLAVDPSAPASMEIDRTRLQQVLLNLLGNAVKFTGQGRVTLRVAGGGAGRVCIDVIDTGPGIPPERRERLFQDFSRLGAEPGLIEGAGLGLAISARLIAAMGGTLRHEPAPGGGSLFRVDLPVLLAARDEPRAEGRGSATACDEPGGASVINRALRVLLVDDVPVNLEIARSFLSAAGHAVTTAGNGGEAVRLATAEVFDVVLMDVRMPGMDGLEATRRIRAADGPAGRVPVIALTAQAFDEQIALCREAGMDSHLAKPFAREALLDAVLRAVGRSEPAAGVPPAARPGEADALDDLARALPPAALRRHLTALRDRTAEFRQAVLGPPETIEPIRLADAAHRLAGSVGMFGFERLASAALRLERALSDGGGDWTSLRPGLEAEIADTLAAMRAMLARLDEQVPA